MRAKQEIFDTVVNHLYTQGKPALIGNSCVYRGEGGEMCAVGCLIPDSVYQEEMEGNAIQDLISDYYNLPKEIYEYKSMLADLQFVHDDWLRTESFDDIAIDFIEVAEDHDVIFNDPRVG